MKLNNEAGSVKGKATAKHAVSDWMDIEKERGISVTSSVLQFEYGGCCINILDTPGHQDFSEDTYRTLMAADSAVMVIDASKGVEAQTRKLFKVCAMRHIRVFTFINKGNAPLIITRASANCGCTKPEYPVKPVAPGKEGQIKVTYQPKGRPGSFSKNIYVYTNGEPERVVLLITGTVIPKP